MVEEQSGNKAQEGEDKEDLSTSNDAEREIEENGLPGDDELIVWFVFFMFKIFEKNGILCILKFDSEKKLDFLKKNDF